MRKEFDNVGQMQKWLKSAVGVAIIAVSLQSDLDQLYTNIASPNVLASIVKASQVNASCTNTPCYVDFEDTPDPDPFPDLVYEQYIAAFFVKVRLRQNNRTYGGPELIVKEIQDYDYLLYTRPADEGFLVGYALIRMPSSPTEVSKLKEILLKQSVWVTIPDGSGAMHLGNSQFGNGLNPA